MSSLEKKIETPGGVSLDATSQVRSIPVLTDAEEEPQKSEYMVPERHKMLAEVVAESVLLRINEKKVFRKELTASRLGDKNKVQLALDDVVGEEGHQLIHRIPVVVIDAVSKGRDAPVHVDVCDYENFGKGKSENDLKAIITELRRDMKKSRIDIASNVE